MLKGVRATPSLILFSKVQRPWNCKNILCGRECTVPLPDGRTNVYCGQTAGWIDMPLGTDVCLGPGDIVLDGDLAPQKGAQQPYHFLADVCCGQTPGWIRIALCTEVGLGRSNTVLDGDPAPQRKRAQRLHPLFGPCLLWPNGRPSQQLLSTC